MSVLGLRELEARDFDVRYLDVPDFDDRVRVEGPERGAVDDVSFSLQPCWTYGYGPSGGVRTADDSVDGLETPAPPWHDTRFAAIHTFFAIGRREKGDDPNTGCRCQRDPLDRRYPGTEREMEGEPVLNRRTEGAPVMNRPTDRTRTGGTRDGPGADARGR